MPSSGYHFIHGSHCSARGHRLNCDRSSDAPMIDEAEARPMANDRPRRWRIVGIIGLVGWLASWPPVPARAQASAQLPAETRIPAPHDAKPMSPTLEDVPYPYPVQYLPLTVYGHDVRMAYMDVPAAGQANGRTVVLLHGMNFYGE